MPSLVRVDGAPKSMHESHETLEQARERNVRDALREDLGPVDWTASLVPASRHATGGVVAKESAVLAGCAWFDACLQSCDPDVEVRWLRAEGERTVAGEEICRFRGRARGLLSAERSALNFLQMLSAVATMTRRYVDAIQGISPNLRGCRVLDTRKTLPGLRQAQKYAVRVGGGMNHRMGLWDAMLIKENHIAAAGGVAQALHAARALAADVTLQIEVENLEELRQALDAGARHILLDDFDLAAMARACEINAGRAELEVSGGVDLDTIRGIAATGVDRISIGKLTKDVQAVDLSMRLHVEELHDGR